jgi:hypothetical protein
MSLDKLIEESGARASLSNATLSDIKNLTRSLFKMAQRRGIEANEEYCFKIAAGIYGNWEWQLKRAKEKGENKLNLLLPSRSYTLH